MRVANLFNQYPTVSDTFIWREILELERMGHVVERHSIRDIRNSLVDPLDVEEARQTHCLLQFAGCITGDSASRDRCDCRRPSYFDWRSKNYATFVNTKAKEHLNWPPTNDVDRLISEEITCAVRDFLPLVAHRTCVVKPALPVETAR